MPEKDSLSPWALISRESNADLANYWPDDVWVIAERLTVPGGWIVRTMIEGRDSFGPAQISTVFVPCSICAKYPSNRIHRAHWLELIPENE